MAVKRGKYKKTVFVIKKKGCAGKGIKVQYKYKGTDSSEIFVLEENMNKLLAKLTAALMLFSLCSCSTAEETDKPIGSNAVYDVLAWVKSPSVCGLRLPTVIGRKMRSGSFPKAV